MNGHLLFLILPRQSCIVITEKIIGYLFGAAIHLGGTNIEVVNSGDVEAS